MKPTDILRLAIQSVFAHRLRSILTALGIAVGITAVVLLTSIGQGVQRLVVTEFTQFGTNLIAVTPGKTETFGISGTSVSNVRPLSLDDAYALSRLSEVTAVVPVLQGNAQAESHNRVRRTAVLGVGANMPGVWSMKVASGRFLPRDDFDTPRSFAVLGARLKKELFGETNALGQRLRVGGDRYRVIGVMETKGQFLGFDLDDVVYVPAAKAMELFDRDSLMEIGLTYRGGASPPLGAGSAHIRGRRTRRDLTFCRWRRHSYHHDYQCARTYRGSGTVTSDRRTPARCVVVVSARSIVACRYWRRGRCGVGARHCCITSHLTAGIARGPTN